MINIYISSIRIALFFTLVLVCICFAGIVGSLNKESLGYLALLLDFDRQTNLATWYQSSLLLLGAFLLSMLTVIKKNTSSRYTTHWTILSVILILLSLDKMVSFHNIFIELANNAPKAQGAANYFWIALVIGILYSVLVVYLSLHNDIPRSTQLLILVASAIYAEGAIGIELIKERIASIPDYSQVMFLIILSLREFLEAIGIIVLIYALISYISTHIKDVQFLIEDNF